MSPLGLSLCCLTMLSGVEPQGLSLSAPQLMRGDEIVYRGEILETSDRLGQRFRKKSKIEVRLFVLESQRGRCDAVVMTSVQPLADPAIASAIEKISGTSVDANAVPPSITLEWIQIDSRGRVQLLQPKISLPPIVLDDAKKIAPPLPPLDGLPTIELGFFVPLPTGIVKLHTKWDIANGNRPPQTWQATSEEVWNGARCLELRSIQESEGWDQPERVRTGWQIQQALLASASDGYASTMTRKINRREGTEIVQTIAMQLEVEPRRRHFGIRHTDMAQEIELAWYQLREAEKLTQVNDSQGTLKAKANLKKLDLYIEDHVAPSSFRPALESARRRFLYASMGYAPPVTVLTPTTHSHRQAELEQVAPDFLAKHLTQPTGQFRLSAQRGRPVILIALKGQSKTSADTYTVAEALWQKYHKQAEIVVIAFGDQKEISTEHQERRLQVPVYRQAQFLELYGVDSFPQMFLLNSQGVLKWRFDAGIGPEVGYLIKTELEKELNPKDANSKR